MSSLTIEDILMYEEGYRESVYYCSEGYPTIGIGTKLGPKGAPLSHYTVKFSKEVAKAHLREEINVIKNKLSGYPWFKTCNEARRIVLISMAYQMGVAGLLTFKNTLALITNKEYAKASDNMLVSKWAKQTPNRAQRHAAVMLTGTLDVYQDLIKNG